MDIRQDPNSIPDFHGGDRLGEKQHDEPETRQSSVGLDSTGSGQDSPLDDGSAASAKRDQQRDLNAP